MSRETSKLRFELQPSDSSDASSIGSSQESFEGSLRVGLAGASDSSAGISTSQSEKEHRGARNAGPWYLSPENLRVTGCSCHRPRSHHDLRTSSDYLELSLDRLDKVWLRVAHRVLPAYVREAAERMFLQMREKGWELCHLAAKLQQSPDIQHRMRTISILFLLPCPDEEDMGHRCIAEILVQVHTSPTGSGRLSEKLCNVATRWQEDWEDWTNGFSHNWFSEEDAKVTSIKVPDISGGVPWSVVTDQLAPVVNQKIASLGWIAPNQLGRLISRVYAELHQKGKRVCGFTVAKVFRPVESSGMPCTAVSSSRRRKSSTTHYSPAVRIALNTIPLNEEPSSRSLDSTQVEVAAVVLLDLDGAGKGEGVKRTMVVYSAEPYVAHEYRNDIPPPSLAGLKRHVKRSKE